VVFIHFSAEDLAHTRFAFSPLWEAMSSFCVLRDPKRHALHLPWVREALAVTADLDLGLLDTLFTHPKRLGHRYFADFLAPYPSATAVDFEAELAALRATPPEEVRRDLARNYGVLPQEPFTPFLVDPEAALHELADVLTLYWQRTLAHHWGRLKGILEADILYRARILALEGPDALLESFGGEVSYEDRRLVICKWEDRRITLAGHGLVLIPSIFSGLGLGELPWQEMLQYRARGAGLAWFGMREEVNAKEALTTLLGAQRTLLVRRLVVPATTGELASLFGVTPGAVSQQLGWLRQAGLVTAERRGKRVYHELSSVGRSLLEAYEELDGMRELALA